MLLSRNSTAAFFSWLILILANLPASFGAEPKWPEGYDIAEGSESPDGRFGVLIPSLEVADKLDDEKIPNTLVELKTHRRIGVIRRAHYFHHQNHSGLGVEWAADSSWCAVTYEGRYGFDQITLAEIKGAACAQTDVGTHIKKALDAAITKQARSASASGDANAHFRPAPGRKILVRAISRTNPKQFDDQPTYCALFQGTFDLASGKWTRSEARKIANPDDFDSAYSDTLEENATFATEENRLSWYDERLNEVYRAARTVLPAARFAEVKKEQVAWLKRLDAAGSIKKKCELMAARIRELRLLVW